MKADARMGGEPLRDANPSERARALSLAGLSSAHYVWVSDAADHSRTLIVCPDVAVDGVAVAVDPEGRELWRKPAFYSELLRAGDGYESQYGSLCPIVRASWDGTWIASVRLPDGSSRRSDTLIFDERVAKQAHLLAEKHAAESGHATPSVDLAWRRVSS